MNQMQYLTSQTHRNVVLRDDFVTAIRLSSSFVPCVLILTRKRFVSLHTEIQV